MLDSRELYRLVQAVACMGGLALSGVASAANFTFIAVLNSGQEIQRAKPNSNSLGTALLTLSTRTRLLCYSISYTEASWAQSRRRISTRPLRRDKTRISCSSSRLRLTALRRSGSPKTGCVGPLTGKQMSNLKKACSTSMFTVRRSLPERSAARSCPSTV